MICVDLYDNNFSDAYKIIDSESHLSNWTQRYSLYLY